MGLSKAAYLACTAAACTLGGWYFYTPVRAAERVIAAAQQGDIAKLDEAMDIGAVRGSISSQLKSRIGSGQPGSAEALGKSVVHAITGKAVDLLVTPDAIMRAIRRCSEQSGPDGWLIDREGTETFVVQCDRADLARHGGLRFRREGMDWTLTEYLLPST